MKRVLLLGRMGMAALLLPVVVAAQAQEACKPLLNHSFPGLLSGNPRSLCEFSGKVVLVVNTASQCGYTPQYEGLEALYKRYQKRGFVVVGFPSNDFGAQEPGTNQEVAEFCKANFGVTFPMFEKAVVSGAQANPFHVALARRSGSVPRWNFHKYLIDRSGNRVVAFDSNVHPHDGRLARDIDRMLAEQPAAQ